MKSVAFVSLLSFALAVPAFAVDIPVSSKFLCRIESGKKPSLIKLSSLKPAKFSVLLDQLNEKIAAAKNNANRIAKTRNKTKLASAKAKVAALAAEKKLVQDCKSGKLNGTPTDPTPIPTVNPNAKQIAGTFEERFGTYTTSGQARCAFFTFFKWPAIEGALFDKISFDRSVNNPPAIPTETEIAPPYDDAYIYRGISGLIETGISFNVDAGFHWVQFGRFDSFGTDCTSEERKAEIANFRAGSNANGFAHRAN